MKKTIIFMIFTIIFLTIIILTNTIIIPYSIIDESTFSNCKMVKDGDVCENYTKCVYSEERQASCIKGYKLILFSLDTNETFEMGMTLVGGSNE